MANNMVINVRVGGTLSEFVSSNISETGSYENVSEYVRDLIRKDKANKEKVAFETLKAELKKAFSAPESEYVELCTDDIIDRHS